jgi:hypothetical protein
MAILFCSVLVTVELPLLFGEKFHFNDQQLGLQFLGIIVGSVIGEQLGDILSDTWITRRAKKNWSLAKMLFLQMKDDFDSLIMVSIRMANKKGTGHHSRRDCAHFHHTTGNHGTTALVHSTTTERDKRARYWPYRYFMLYAPQLNLAYTILILHGHILYGLYGNTANTGHQR